MTNKEIFLEELERIDNNIAIQNENKKLLKEDYIVENKEFEIGEKVKVITPERTNDWNNKTYPEEINIGFIANVSICNWTGNIKYSCFKCKKDGKPSMHKMYIDSNDKIVKYE